MVNIFKMLNLFKRMGIGELVVEYWDEFLFRGIRLEFLFVMRMLVVYVKMVLFGVVIVWVL